MRKLEQKPFDVGGNRVEMKALTTWHINIRDIIRKATK